MRGSVSVPLVFLLGCLAGKYYTVVDHDVTEREAVDAVLRVLRPAVAGAEHLRIAEEHGHVAIRVGYHRVGAIGRNIVVHVYRRSIWVAVDESDARGDPPAREPGVFDQKELARRIERALRAP